MIEVSGAERRAAVIAERGLAACQKSEGGGGGGGGGVSRLRVAVRAGRMGSRVCSLAWDPRPRVGGAFRCPDRSWSGLSYEDGWKGQSCEKFELVGCEDAGRLGCCGGGRGGHRDSGLAS